MTPTPTLIANPTATPTHESDSEPDSDRDRGHDHDRLMTQAFIAHPLTKTATTYMGPRVNMKSKCLSTSTPRPNGKHA